MQGKYKFLSHSAGTFTAEDSGKDIQYDKVELSDGLRAFKVKNTVHASVLKEIPAETLCLCAFDVNVNKAGGAVLILSDIQVA